MVLACSVRNCLRPLERVERTYRCNQGHSFDIARQGYVNLLQPQDRKSLEAGDSRAAVDARVQLLAEGVGAMALEAMRARSMVALHEHDSPVVVDLGCGSGELVASVAAEPGVVGIGIDLSVHAAEHAARRYPEQTWVVANADRRLPILDASVHLTLSLHARRNPAECARVLTHRGLLIVAVPAADDLIELREVVGGASLERERGNGVRDEHASRFDVIDREQVRERRELGRASLLALLKGTYRGERQRGAERMAGVESLAVTMASEIWTLRRR